MSGGGSPCGRPTRTIARLVVAALAAVVLAGCLQPSTSRTPTRAGINPADLVDADPPAGQARPPAVMRKLVGVAEQVREAQRPAVTPAKRSVLVLSGGGAYGAYPAGFLVGWTRTGTRPEFDVVTGVSTGALIAALAFLGPEFDCELERVYTTLTTEEIYRKKRGACGPCSPTPWPTTPPCSGRSRDWSPRRTWPGWPRSTERAAGSTSGRPTWTAAGRSSGTWGRSPRRGPPRPGT